MKVAYVTSFYPRKGGNQVGGAELNLMNISDYIKNNGFEVHFITTRMGLNSKNYEYIDRVHVHYRPELKFSFLNLLFLPVYLWVTMHNTKADIYHQRGSSFETILIALYCKLFNKIFVFTPAHLFHLTLNRYHTNPFYINQIIGLAIKQADYITLLASYMIPYLKQRFPKIPYKVIKNSISTNSNSITHFEEKEKIVLFIARIEYWKRPDIFIKIAKSVKNKEFKFIMIGPKTKFHSDKYYQNLKNQINKTKNLVWMGKLPFNRTEDWIRKSSIYLHTSKYEGFPNTFLQCWKYFTKVITYEWDPEKLFDDEVLGINLKKDVSKFSQILSNEYFSSWKKNLVKANKYVRENHSIEVIGKEYLNLYCNLLENKKILSYSDPQ